MKISPKYFISAALICFVLLCASFISLPDGRMHLVFCNVGQGDAIYIRTAGGEDILMDGGPNDSVLSCISKYMPFYDRTIELMILSHPQADHLSGLISVLERYNVNYFISSGIGSQTEGYKKIIGLLKNKKVLMKSEFSGGKINLDNLTLKTIWPTKGEENVLGASTSESSINTLSLMMELNYGQFSALLTGDADQSVQKDMKAEGIGVNKVDILKVPHHGSKTALLNSFLDEIKPQLAVISVGKNSYGHPSSEVLKQLSSIGSKMLRTDKDGDIEIVSDGKSWWRSN